MTVKSRTAPPVIQQISGRELPLTAADIPWLALPVPIPHSTLSLPARILLAEFFFFPICRALALLSARYVSIPEGPEIALLP
jgi:hypothetical protein